MFSSIICSIITGGLALIGVIYTSRKQHDLTISEVRTEIALIKKDITTLEASVKKHNNVVERMYEAEKAISVIQERQDVANHRITDLEEDNHNGR